MRGLRAQMSIGMMDELVSFRTPTYSRDAYGAVVPAVDDTVYPTYRAQVEDLSAKEAPTDTPQEKVTRLIRIQMRSLGTNNPKQADMVTWRSEEYDIIDIHFLPRRRFMIIDARLHITGT